MPTHYSYLPTGTFSPPPSQQSFETSGLGERIANIFVSAFGHSSLGLAYGLTFAEALVAPALPSSTARAGVGLRVCVDGMGRQAVMQVEHTGAAVELFALPLSA